MIIARHKINEHFCQISGRTRLDALGDRFPHSQSLEKTDIFIIEKHKYFMI